MINNSLSALVWLPPIGLILGFGLPYMLYKWPSGREPKWHTKAKGGMNPHPDPNYVPPRPAAFKSSILPRTNLNIPMPAGAKPPRAPCDKCGTSSGETPSAPRMVVSPAMVEVVYEWLEECGFLDQAHHSPIQVTDLLERLWLASIQSTNRINKL